MATLFELDTAIAEALEIALTESIDPETGEILQGGFEQLEQLSAERDTKIENIGAYIKNLTAEADAIKAEEKSLAERRKAKENKIARLKDYVSFSLQNAGQSKFESAKVAFSFRKSTSVNITNLEAVPAEYIKIKEEKTADKTVIGKLLKAGQEIAGCELVEKQSLQIK